jgi:hypothetical protein
LSRPERADPHITHSFAKKGEAVQSSFLSIGKGEFKSPRIASEDDLANGGNENSS